MLWPQHVGAVKSGLRVLACFVQALVRAYVRGSTDDTAEQQQLTDEELQEGLMAGFGARARRKHMQRHAASLAAKGEEAADVSADMADGQGSAADASSLSESSTAPTTADSHCVAREVTGTGALQVAERRVEPATGKLAVSSCTLSAGDPDGDQEVANGFADSEGVQNAAAEEVMVRGTAVAASFASCWVCQSSHFASLTHCQSTDKASADWGQETPAATAARDGNKGGHQWHGRKVVEAVLERGGEEELCALMARFRQCFVDALHPRHLSPAWQVDHRCECQTACCSDS